jgi:predicted component of type VI protein secretion system
MKCFRLLACGLLCLTALNAAAQWQWLDTDGRRVFSDRPPPSDVPEKSILKRPGNRSGVVSYPASTPAPAPTVAAPSGIDKSLQEKRKQVENEQAAKRKAEEERAAQTRADNCSRAQRAKTGLDSGLRMTRTNENGEREFLDDSGRATEAARLQTDIDENCR